MKCPKCGTKIEKIGIISEYTQVFDIKTKEYDSSDSEVGDTISTYCLECGENLPNRFKKLTEKILNLKKIFGTFKRDPETSTLGIRMLKVDNGMLTLDKKDIDYESNNHIWIKVKGVDGNREDPDGPQIMLEWYDGELQIHVWNKSIEPQTIKLEYKSEYDKVRKAKKKSLPKLIHVTDPDAKELLNRRLKGEKQ